MKHAFALIGLSLVAVPALAGPPLVCHKVETGGAPSLPWNARTEERLSSYDTENLARDTAALLGPGAPVLARMETLRRAALYASRDPRAGHAVQTTLLARAREHPSDGLAIFDAGYFTEAWNQADMRAAGPRTDHTKPLGDSAYAWVTRALTLSKGNPEIEYAAALMSWYPLRPEHDAHVARAAAAAKANALLARNLQLVKGT